MIFNPDDVGGRDYCPYVGTWYSEEPSKNDLNDGLDALIKKLERIVEEKKYEQESEEEGLIKPTVHTEITINGKPVVLNGKIDKDLQKQLWGLEDKLSKALKELREINAALYNPEWKADSTSIYVKEYNPHENEQTGTAYIEDSWSI